MHQSRAGCAGRLGLYIACTFPCWACWARCCHLGRTAARARKTAGQTVAARCASQQYLCALACVPGMARAVAPDPILAWTQVPGPSPQCGAVPGRAGPGACCRPLFRVFSTLSRALGHPQWSHLAAGGFTAGQFRPCPSGGRLAVQVSGDGVVGCGWATLVVNCGMFGRGPVAAAHANVYAPGRSGSAWNHRKHACGWPPRGALRRWPSPWMASFTLMAHCSSRARGTLASMPHRLP